MELNPRKSSLSDLRSGINYLGYRVVQTDSPKNPAKLRSQPKRNWDFIADLRALEKKGLPKKTKSHPFAIAPNYKAQRERLASINSRLGLFKHSESYRFKKQAMEHFRKQTVSLTINLQAMNQDQSEVSITEDEWSPFVIKEDFSSIKLS